MIKAVLLASAALFGCLLVATSALQDPSFDSGQPRDGRDVSVFVNVYTHPKTQFSCADKQVHEYYADPETNCAIYYICLPLANGKLAATSFACPNGTIFSQATRVCTTHENTYCRLATRFYDSVHGNIDSAGKDPSEVSQAGTLLYRNAWNTNQGINEPRATRQPQQPTQQSPPQQPRQQPPQQQPRQQPPPPQQPSRQPQQPRVQVTPDIERQPVVTIQNRPRPAQAFPQSFPQTRPTPSRSVNQLIPRRQATAAPTTVPPTTLNPNVEYEYVDYEIPAEPIQPVPGRRRRSPRRKGTLPSIPLDFLASPSEQTLVLSDFTCSDKIAGIAYADIANNCTMFHLCLPSEVKGKLVDHRMFCKEGQAYNQDKGACQTLGTFDCRASEKFFLYNKLTKEDGRRKWPVQKKSWEKRPKN